MDLNFSEYFDFGTLGLFVFSFVGGNILGEHKKTTHLKKEKVSCVEPETEQVYNQFSKQLLSFLDNFEKTIVTTPENVLFENIGKLSQVIADVLFPLLLTKELTAPIRKRILDILLVFVELKICPPNIRTSIEDYIVSMSNAIIVSASNKSAYKEALDVIDERTRTEFFKVKNLNSATGTKKASVRKKDF